MYFSQSQELLYKLSQWRRMSSLVSPNLARKLAHSAGSIDSLALHEAPSATTPAAPTIGDEQLHLPEYPELLDLYEQLEPLPGQAGIPELLRSDERAFVTPPLPEAAAPLPGLFQTPLDEIAAAIGQAAGGDPALVGPPDLGLEQRLDDRFMDPNDMLFPPPF